MMTKTVMKQSLTRVSISRKSREEMTHVFLSRAGELYFHFSFSSRFSRFLDNKSLSCLDLQDSLNQFSFSSRFSRLWRQKSLSTLDSWDSVLCFSFSSCEKCFIFLERNMHFQGLRFGGKLLCNEVLGGYLMSEKENFSFSSRKLWTLDFSFSSQNRGTGFYISLSLLENGDIVFTFSFSSRSLSIENPFLFLLSKVEHILLEFSFPSRNWRKEFPVSLSSLETGEKNF